MPVESRSSVPGALHQVEESFWLEFIGVLKKRLISHHIPGVNMYEAKRLHMNIQESIPDVWNYGRA